MVTAVDNPFDSQPSSPINGGIVGGTIQTLKTGAPGQTPYQQYNPTPTVQAQTYTPQTREVNRDTETVQGQVASILSQDSPLMQRARTLATQQMAQRGLVNSSMAAGAGVAAMTDRAMQIGSQDAQTYSNRSLANMEATNQGNQFNVGQTNDMFRFGQDVASRYGLQTEAQKFQGVQAEIERAQQQKLQANQFGFQSQQSEMERQQQLRMQELQEAGVSRRQAEEIAAREALQTSQLQFQGGENAVQREVQMRMQELEQAGADRRQAQEIASREAIVRLEQAGVTNRFDQELALKSDMFNVEQLNADRRQVLSNEFELQKLGVQIKANNQSIPTAFAANISNTTMQGVGQILSDGNLTPEAKKGAIDNLVNYANSQIGWAEKFYATAIPPISLPGSLTPAPPPAPVAAPAPAFDYAEYQRWLNANSGYDSYTGSD
jgi:hypothetical protein